MAPDLLARGDPIADHTFVVAPLLLGEGVVADDGKRPPAGADALAPQGPRRVGSANRRPGGPREPRPAAEARGTGDSRPAFRSRELAGDAAESAVIAGRPCGAECRSRTVHRQAKFNVPSPVSPSALSNRPAATGSGKRAANTAARIRIGPRPGEHPGRPAQRQTAGHEDQDHVSPGQERAGQRRGDDAVGDEPTQEDCR